METLVSEALRIVPVIALCGASWLIGEIFGSWRTRNTIGLEDTFLYSSSPRPWDSGAYIFSDKSERWSARKSPDAKAIPTDIGRSIDEPMRDGPIVAQKQSDPVMGKAIISNDDDRFGLPPHDASPSQVLAHYRQSVLDLVSVNSIVSNQAVDRYACTGSRFATLLPCISVITPIAPSMQLADLKKHREKIEKDCTMAYVISD